MNCERIGRTFALVLSAMAVMLIVSVLPPVAQRIRHLCPVRPDGVSEAGAMPQWARRYGVSCSVCHTTVPALTQAGYKFRSAGFRMPDEIGNEAKFKDISDMYSARIREEFRIAGTKTDGTAANAKVGATNKFVFHELTFYPVSGAFGKWWSAESELTFVPDEFVEVENAYVRATVPVNPDLYLTARAGIFHPFEGYGASDRAISNIRPLIWTSTAKNGAFDTKVKLQTQDQEGAEVGATYKDTRVSLAILNGYNSALGGANLGDDNNLRDFLFFANQMIGDKAAVSFEYLAGKTGFTYAGGAGSDWINNYQRGSLYASYEILANNKLDILGGYELGKDHFVTAGTNSSDTFNSTGWYLEGRSKLHEHFTGGLRVETFDPSTRTGSNRITATTLTGSIPIDNIKFLLDYQVKRTQKAAPIKDVTENIVRAEWMMIF